MLRPARRALLALALFAAAGCGHQRTTSLLGPGNQSPTLELRGRPAGVASAGRTAYQLEWIARDADGRVDHYEVSDDLRVLSGDKAAWRRSTASFERLSLRSRFAAKAPGDQAGALTIFAVRAVDDRGAVSKAAIRAFIDDNVAPLVQITAPQPSALARRYVPSAFEIHWQGSDPDGSTGLPVKYKYRLFSQNDPEFPLSIALNDPDSIRRYYAPGFAGWDSVPGETLGVAYSNLILGEEYLFAVIAIDEQGAYSPVFSRNSNLLYMRVVSGTFGPTLTVQSSFFEYSRGSGGFYDDPAVAPLFDYPKAIAFDVSWFGVPVVGSEVTAYRWVLDPADPVESVTRHSLDGAPGEWSEWSLNATSTTIGPFRGPAALSEHRLYIEARDDVGLTSRLLVRFRPILATFEKELLVVDDTRRPPTTGNAGLWPSAAELDTFLFARGGFPWAGKPAGTLSPPGVFEGYAYDTLGTRTGQTDLTVPLSLLSQYRHVVWITSLESATNFSPGTDPVAPISALRFMSGPGRENTLAAYVEAGGGAWVLGSSGYSSMIPWNRLGNDTPQVGFSYAFNELIPGRFMYDRSGWRSEFRVQPFSSPSTPRLQPGVASLPPPSQFPAALTFRRSGTDPVPPGRTSGTFYVTSAVVEYLTQPNEVLEYALPPNGDQLTTVLDTLYRILPPTGVPYLTCMTSYRGRESGHVVQMGFDLWSWRRSDCVALTDGVLQGMWGLTRSGPSPVASVRASRFIEPTSTPKGAAALTSRRVSTRR